MKQLDVRGLPPCQPFEQALAAVHTLAPGEALTLYISREPHPLYGWLDDNGLDCCATVAADGACTVVITRPA